MGRPINKKNNIYIYIKLTCNYIIHRTYILSVFFPPDKNQLMILTLQQSCFFKVHEVLEIQQPYAIFFIIVISIMRCLDRGAEMLSNISKVTQLICRGPRIKISAGPTILTTILCLLFLGISYRNTSSVFSQLL